MMQAVQKGLTDINVEGVGSCAMAIFCFIFNAVLSLWHTWPYPLSHWSSGCVTRRLGYRNGKSNRRQLILSCFDSLAAEEGSGPSALLHRWTDLRPASDGLFNLRANERSGAGNLPAGWRVHCN